MSEEIIIKPNYENGKYSARYLWLDHLRASSYVVIKELYLATNSDLKLPWSQAPTAIAQNQYGNNPPADAFDGNPNTIWHASGATSWFHVDFKQVVRFDQLVVLNMKLGEEGYPQYYIQDYDISLGETEEQMSLVKSVRNQPIGTGYKTILN